MAYTRTWDANYEIAPANANNVGDGANHIRMLKVDVRERLATDHYFATNGTDADHGEHSKVTLRISANAPANAANKGMLYSANASNLVELFYKDNANHVTQLTSNGASSASFPAGTKMLFYQNTAPSGWAIITTMNDRLVFVTSGSGAGGQTGGNTHSSGTWTQSNHSHTATGVAHSHFIYGYGLSANGMFYDANVALFDFPGSNVIQTVTTTYRMLLTEAATSGSTYKANAVLRTSEANGATATSNNATANTWRPSSYCFICCNKS